MWSQDTIWAMCVSIGSLENVIPWHVHRQWLTCNNTNTPPKKNARAFAPFLTKTPAQTPQMDPNVSSYILTLDSGGGGRPVRSGGPGDVHLERGEDEAAAEAAVPSTLSTKRGISLLGCGMIGTYTRNSVFEGSYRATVPNRRRRYLCLSILLWQMAPF
jgi:hypothetical protein